MQFSLDRKGQSHKQNQCSASDSVGLIFTRSYRFTLLITTPTTTPSLVKTSLKNVVFPAQAEYSYFSADFRLKISVYYSSNIIAYDISVLEFIGVQVFGIWICIALRCACAQSTTFLSEA